MSIFDKQVLVKLRHTVGEETVCEIIDLFFEHTPQRIKAVRAGGRSGDHKAATIALHTMKSSAAMLGAIELSEISEEMERIAREETPEAVAPLVGRLEEAYVRARAFLQAERQRHDLD